MRKIMAALFLLSIAALARGQQSFGSAAGRPVAVGRLPDMVPDESVRTKFLNQEWTPAVVTFKNGAPAMKVPVLFDEFAEKAYYQEGTTTMEFNHPIASISMLLLIKGDTAYVTFRNSYPPVHKNTGETFYEVLVDGKFQLLSCKAKTIGLYKEDVPEDQRKDQIKEMIYAFFPDGQMVEIKKDKDYLYTLPKYGEVIKSMAASKKLKLKNDKALKELFQYLNEQ
ncbi:hypothetical protein HB364_18820 [Pseudoflavitalea sp. X16]|uniref:hypothetical protein n=1 Tax=Paraflavitalea devenefica TaxID=2716334 RepID=UPI001422922C|nr:hypothetical protein [Paraflavitalea devenefica]NII27148.1 hypothetical protein [Paraflavitalea devenefica]